LWERLFSRENLFAALAQVQSNGGAPGVDGLTVEDLPNHLRAHWLSIRAKLETGSYQPSPVKRVEIPKPEGGVRLLGIPTALDRFLQTALHQVLSPLFEPTFSAHSYGFRPGRSAHDAVKAAQGYIRQGYQWVVDIDLARFFDTVHHDRLMARLGEVVKDRRILSLIRAYLKAGILVNGVVIDSEQGTPQGGPLSPLLSNIVLTELDRKLEERGLHFVRYADDCNIYVKSQRAAQRVMTSTQHFIERRLRLTVNQAKSAVDKATKRKFLGFSFTWQRGVLRIRVAPQSLERILRRVHDLTGRRQGQSLATIRDILNPIIIGWVGYFALSDAARNFEEVDSHLRRRLRQLAWVQWKTSANRFRQLRSRGVSIADATLTVRTRKGPWRMSHTPALERALDKTFFLQLGLVSFLERYRLCRA
jgi:group II intron reverse transcriptase/maturase